MKSVEDLTKELDEVTNESFEKAQELSDILKKYNDIDLGISEDEEEDEDHKNNIKGFFSSVDARRQAVLRRILAEWGGLLFL